MEIRDISGNGKEFFKSEEQGKPWNTSTDLEGLGADKIESLKQEIIEIETLIEGRERLSQAVFNEGDKIKIEINNFLRELNPVGVDSTKDKVTLKQKQIEIAEFQLKEKINCWQDIAKLREELRNSRKELTERQSRLDMLGKILEE